MIIYTLTAIDEKREGRPIVLLGTRGRGKSHLMAAMHHALSTPEAAEKWARVWANQGAGEHPKDLHPARGYTLITTDMNEHTYRTLWEVLFDFNNRLVGQRFRGRFEGLNQDVPPKDLIVEMLKVSLKALRIL